MMVSDGFVWTMTFIGLMSCPSPPILWSSLHVMTTTRIWKVFCLDVTLRIPFHSHLMRNGGAMRGVLLVVDAFVWFEGLLVFLLVFNFLGSVF